MNSGLIAGALVAALALVSACERDLSALPARDHADDASVQPVAFTEEAAAPDPRDAPVPEFKGRPMWSANRDNTAEQNAQAQFERNGETFGAASVDDYIAKAHAFTGAPPRGAETATRANGDTLIYDPASNTFAVKTKTGAPRTMFKPDDGPTYWAEQKAQAAGG